MADEKAGKSRASKTAATTRGRARSAQGTAVVSVVPEAPGAHATGVAEVPAQTRSGVVPVLFSASAEAHDVAVVAEDSGAEWRSPFGASLRPASGE